MPYHLANPEYITFAILLKILYNQVNYIIFLSCMNEKMTSEIIIPWEHTTLKEFLKLQKRYPVIAITGPAWVWKSTITRELASYLGSKIFTEIPEYNPFLKIIRETGGRVNDITLWSNNQNYFLATDVAEITKAFIQAKDTPIVFDFALTQPFIFADIQLNGNALQAFNTMYHLQFESLPKPDIVIEVGADNETILRRLQARGKHIDDFVQKMVEKLNGYYKWWIVSENYESEGTKVIYFDNWVQFPNPWDIKQKVIQTLWKLI